MGLTDEEKRCMNCGEDFPVSAGRGVQMGQLYPLKKFDGVKQISGRFGWAMEEDDAYLCGNCYFDATD